MKPIAKSTRNSERTKQVLPVQVHYYPQQGVEWTETAQITEFSQNGAGLELNHPVEIGRLIKLSFPLPCHQRVFDFQAKDYVIWAVIRDVQLAFEIQNSDRLRIKIGTAFTGKNPPAGFFQDVTTRYDLKPVLMKNNLWDLRERPRNSGRFARQEEVRHLISMEVVLKLINEHGEFVRYEIARTQNISQSGAAVLTELAVNRGQFILLVNKEPSFELMAIVRGCQVTANISDSILNLEFVSGKWLFDQNL